MLRLWIGNRAKKAIPGLVRPTVIDDPVTGQHIEIRVGALFTACPWTGAITTSAVGVAS
jgi:hypothetical protein